MTVQFNREASKGKRFQMDTIAGSDAIAQLGSVIIAVQPGQEPYEETRRNLESSRTEKVLLLKLKSTIHSIHQTFTEVEYVTVEDTELKI
jgi:hypothetical protein